MKHIFKLYNIRRSLLCIMLCALCIGFASCTDLDEKVYDRIDAGVYYQNEASVKGAVAAIYGQTSQTLAGENFFHLSEYPADQITWRVWIKLSINFFATLMTHVLSNSFREFLSSLGCVGGGFFFIHLEIIVSSM